ncbi:hypothetical protein IID04_03160 [PVC group bacterium]|nr:hypothetical protein [PVC group bacterium]
MILASDFIVTYESTAVLEAMILQKPVIVIDLYDDMRENFFISQGAVLLAHNVDSLKDCMRQLNSNQDNIVSQLNDRSREFLRDYASIGVLKNPPKFSEELLKSIQ